MNILPAVGISRVRNLSDEAEGDGFLRSKSYPLTMNSTLILSDLILSNQSQFIKLQNHDIMIVCPDAKSFGVEHH